MEFNLTDLKDQMETNLKVSRFKKQHYLVGLLGNSQVAGHEVKLRNFNLNGISILPNVSYMRTAVEIPKVTDKIDKVPMFRFFLKENYSEADWMDLYAKKEMFERQKKDVKELEKQEISLFQLTNFNKKLHLEAYWMGQLLSNNGNFSVKKNNNLGTDTYEFKQTLNNIDNIPATEINRQTIAEMIMKARNKNDVDTVLLGQQAATNYMNNAPAMFIPTLEQLQYTPAGYSNKTNAKGVTLIDKVAGCNILSVTGNVDLMNSTGANPSNVVNIFEPTAIAIIDSQNIGIRYTGITERIENKQRVIDDSEMSFYTVNAGDTSDKNIIFKSEGNMLIALKNPESITTAKITGGQ